MERRIYNIMFKSTEVTGDNFWDTIPEERWQQIVKLFQDAQRVGVTK